MTVSDAVVNRDRHREYTWRDKRLAGVRCTVNVLVKMLRVLWIRPYRSAFLRYRVAASTEHDAILGGLQVDTVVDIGANRGQFALCARHLFPGAKIFSFEPLRIPADTYRRVFKRDPGVVLKQAAVSGDTGEATMHVSRWDVSSSLLPIGKAQRDNFLFTAEARLEKVSTIRLTDAIDPTSIEGTALLKLDVQGFELAALHACGALLDRFRYVYLEASFVELYVGQALAGELCRFLFSKGFELSCVANLSFGRSKTPIQADFLFARVTY